MKSDPLKEAAEKLNTQAPEGEQLAFINPMEALLLKEMGGSGKPAAGGVPSFKKGDVSPPPPRDVGKETRDNLQAQVDLAPELFSSEQKYRPQYADLERRMMLEQMGVDPSKGLLQAYEEDFAPSMVRQKEATVKGDIDMLKEYGSQLLQAQRDADPLADSLRQGIMDSAAEDLAAGMGLTETEQRDLDQQILAGAADRGMEGQGSTFGDMISQRLSANRGIKQQRLANAANAFKLAPTLGIVRPKISAIVRTFDPFDSMSSNALSSFSVHFLYVLFLLILSLLIFKCYHHSTTTPVIQRLTKATQATAIKTSCLSMLFKSRSISSSIAINKSFLSITPPLQSHQAHV